MTGAHSHEIHLSYHVSQHLEEADLIERWNDLWFFEEIVTIPIRWQHLEG